MGENDGPCFFVSCNVHPEDELGLTKVRHAELLPNGPLHRLNQFERFRDKENVVHIYQYNTYIMHLVVHSVEVLVRACSLNAE
jgi:hypothetical protein